MRGAEEVKYASEVLRQAIERPVVAGPDLRICIAVKSALCWVLGCDGDEEFLENFDGLKETLLACGVHVDEAF